MMSLFKEITGKRISGRNFILKLMKELQANRSEYSDSEENETEEPPLKK